MRPATSVSSPAVTACWPITATFVCAVLPTVTAPSGQRPSSQGRPDGCLISCTSGPRKDAATVLADSQSGRTTNQDGRSLKSTSLAMPTSFYDCSTQLRDGPGGDGECRTIATRVGPDQKGRSVIDSGP